MEKAENLNLINEYYDGLKTPVFYCSKKKALWQNKAADRFVKNKRLIKRILELNFKDGEGKENFIFEGRRYEATIRPFNDCFFVEIFEENANTANLIRKFYDRLKTPVFLCRGSNVIWHNVSATEYFKNFKLKQIILQFKDCEEEKKESFICNDYFYKAYIRPFEDSYYVEIIEEQPVGFNVKKEQLAQPNEVLESEVLDNIARSVVHDISQALSQISEILEKNDNFAGLKFVDIILKRMYSFIRATNLCYEYEILLQEKDNMNAEIVDIFVEIDALCSAIKSLIGKSQISFEWDVPDDKIFCDIDMHKLGFALFHIICNSYRFSLPGSEIKVVARLDEYNFIRIDVYDNGVGISKEISDKILKPFFSRDEASGDIAGVGLGLTYVGLFADKVNGTLEITPLEKGTKVSLSMPIVPLSDVMGLSSHIVNYGDGKYDNMVLTLIGDLNRHEESKQDISKREQKIKV